jgi:hypothetical protein
MIASDGLVYFDHVHLARKRNANAIYVFNFFYCIFTAGGDDSVLPAAILLSSTIESIEQLHAKEKFEHQGKMDF